MRLDDQWHLAAVAAHLAAPAPVAARLLTGDAALLEQGDLQAPLGKFHGRAGADDAAADDGDVNAVRKGVVAFDDSREGGLAWRLRVDLPAALAKRD
jgi:hypothetical protein